MSWFRAVQSDDVPAVFSLTSARAQRSVGHQALRKAVDTVGSALGSPIVVRVVTQRAVATVRVLIIPQGPASSGPAIEVPLTLPLVDGASGWQIDDVTYLVTSAQDIPRAAQVKG